MAEGFHMHTKVINYSSTQQAAFLWHCVKDSSLPWLINKTKLVKIVACCSRSFLFERTSTKTKFSLWNYLLQPKDLSVKHHRYGTKLNFGLYPVARIAQRRQREAINYILSSFAKRPADAEGS